MQFIVSVCIQPGPCCPLPLVLELHRHPALPLQQLAVTPFQVGNEMLLYWHCSWLQNVPFYLFFFPLSPYILPGNTLIYGIILANPNPGEHKLVCAW